MNTTVMISAVLEVIDEDYNDMTDYDMPYT